MAHSPKILGLQVILETMTRTFTRSLARRVEALESTTRKAMPQERDVRLEMAITAMASAWTSDEIEEILTAAEHRQLDELPVDLRRRWAEHVDRISIQRFGKPFGDLLAVAPADIDVPRAPPRASQR